MKISIEKVSNGYILRWIRHGTGPMGMLKEPYGEQIFVFETFRKLQEYLADKLDPGEDEA